MFERIKASLQEASHGFALDDNPRRSELERLGTWLSQKAASGEAIKLTVICTHNSRRSHLGQFWAQAAADLLGVDLNAYSGGTQATATHPNTLAALQRAGAEVVQLTQETNPHHRIAYGSEEGESIEAWSKMYDDPANPQTGFAALMVCSDANEGCPFVAGAEARFSLPYIDPKRADGTAEEAAAYDEASRIIAGEMHWLVAKAKNGLQP